MLKSIIIFRWWLEVDKYLHLCDGILQFHLLLSEDMDIGYIIADVDLCY